MRTFDPKSNNWSTFIHNFDDIVNEMGEQGQEITPIAKNSIVLIPLVGIIIYQCSI